MRSKISRSRPTPATLIQALIKDNLYTAGISGRMAAPRTVIAKPCARKDNVVKGEMEGKNTAQIVMRRIPAQGVVHIVGEMLVSVEVIVLPENVQNPKLTFTETWIKYAGKVYRFHGSRLVGEWDEKNAPVVFMKQLV